MIRALKITFPIVGNVVVQGLVDHRGIAIQVPINSVMIKVCNNGTNRNCWNAIAKNEKIINAIAGLTNKTFINTTLEKDLKFLQGNESCCGFIIIFNFAYP